MSIPPVAALVFTGPKAFLYVLLPRSLRASSIPAFFSHICFGAGIHEGHCSSSKGPSEPGLS